MSWLVAGAYASTAPPPGPGPAPGVAEGARVGAAEEDEWARGGIVRQPRPATGRGAGGRAQPAPGGPGPGPGVAQNVSAVEATEEDDLAGRRVVGQHGST